MPHVLGVVVTLCLCRFVRSPCDAKTCYSQIHGNSQSQTKDDYPWWWWISLNERRPQIIPSCENHLCVRVCLVTGCFIAVGYGFHLCFHLGFRQKLSSADTFFSSYPSTCRFCLRRRRASRDARNATSVGLGVICGFGQVGLVRIFGDFGSIPTFGIASSDDSTCQLISASNLSFLRAKAATAISAS